MKTRLFIFCCIAPLFFGCSSSQKIVFQKEPNLCSKLETDLKYIHGSISNNFVGYVHNKTIKEKADRQFQTEMNLVGKCNSNVEYLKSIRRYFAVFHDPHVGPRWELSGALKDVFEASSGKPAPKNSISLQYTATGLYVVKYGNRFFVKSKDEKVSDIKDVNVGDELISCAQKKPLDILEQDILPYETVSAKEAALTNFTPNLFFRWDLNPGSKIDCTFRRDQKDFNKSLVWNSTSQSYIKDNFQQSSSKVYEIEKTPYGHYVKVKTFSGYSDEINQQLQAFADDAKKLRDDNVIVVDIRGNTGGSSAWGESWAKNLYGYSADLVAETNALLASPDNVNHFKRLMVHLEKTKGTSGNEEYLNRLTDAMNRNHNQLSPIAPAPKTALQTKTSTGFKGKVFLLTDSRVFSSGEMYVEMMRAMPRVTQAGLPTNASTYYTDIRFDLAPSGLAFNHPTIAQFGGDLKRESGAAFIPELPLAYDPKLELQGIDSLRVALENVIGKR